MKRIKRNMVTIVSLLVFFLFMPVLVTHADESSEIEINSVNFPDGAFRSYIKTFDTNLDGIFQRAEISRVKSISIEGALYPVKSMKGIEFFDALTDLKIVSSPLTNLDLSKNTALTTLYFSRNQLTNLDLNKNTALTMLTCREQLTNLDLSNNTALISIDCVGNQLTNLDLSNNTALLTIYCGSNQLTGLELSNNTALENLECGYNQLTNLDLSKNTDLKKLECSGNQLSNLDLSNNMALTTLSCANNQLISLDVSNHTELKKLYCVHNQLTSLDISYDTALENVQCEYNELSQLDLQNNPRFLEVFYNGEIRVDSLDGSYLTFYKYYYPTQFELYVDSSVRVPIDVEINDRKIPDEKFRNYLSESFDKDGDGVLEASEIRNITKIDCSYRDIQSLYGIQYFSELEELNCEGNAIGGIGEIKRNRKLIRLNCSDNNIGGLDLRYELKDLRLKSLDCSGNSMHSLNVSNDILLERLNCTNNELCMIDISESTVLKSFHCDKNAIEELNLNNNKQLTDFSCSENKLNILDVSDNVALTNLKCFGNQLDILDICSNPKLIYVYKNGKKSEYEAQSGTIVEYCYEQPSYNRNLAFDKKTKLITEEELQPLKITLSGINNGVKITWKEVNKAAKYRIYKKNSKGKWTKLDTVTTLKYTDSSVVAGEKATYAVVALSSEGKELNLLDNGTSITYIAPAMDATVKYKVTGVAVSWKELSGAAKYRVFRKVGNGEWTNLTTTTSLSFVDKTVVYGKTYSYAVRALTSGGSFVSKMGNGISIKYFAPTPKITLENTNDGVKINWKAMSGADKYRIFVKNTSGSWTKLATVKSGTTYIDKTAKNGKIYTYSVVGMDSSGRLMNDYGQGATIQREKPAMTITLKSVAAGVKISWKAYDGAGKYRVYRKNSDGSWTMLTTIKVADNVLFYRDTEAKDGKKYTYTVIAMTSGGSALTGYGEGTSIKYVKPVSEAEVLEAEVVDENGNTLVRTVTEDEITEDFVEIITDDSSEEIIDDEDNNTEEDAEDISSEDEIKEDEDDSKESISEDSEDEVIVESELATDETEETTLEENEETEEVFSEAVLRESETEDKNLEDIEETISEVVEEGTAEVA